MCIIKSALDTDQYKLTMQQAFLHQYPGAEAEYRFRCRTKGIDLVQFIPEIEEELNEFCETIRFQTEELDWLSRLRFFKHDYIDYLSMFRFNRKLVRVERADVAGEIEIIAEGPLVRVMPFEIYVLAIVNEVYFRNTVADPDYKEGERRLIEKVGIANAAPLDFKFADFGTRRRFSREWQEKVVRMLRETCPIHFTGTSNMDLARRYSLTPIGTMAHEFLQAFQALGPRLVDSQKAALEAWVMEYRGDLGIALTDVAGLDAFLRDFDLYFGKLFDGVRHDSGDPVVWGEKMLRHYEALKIDARTKSFVFSDGLNMPKAVSLYEKFEGRAKTFFGIGTNLTNDLGYKPLEIVMKMVKCNGQPVAKVSDSSGKTMCKDDEFLNYFKKVFHIAA